VDDVVSACLLAANTNHPGVYNIAGPSSISMHDLAELMVRLIPESKSHVFFSNETDPQDDYRWEIDLSKAKKQLGYSPGVPISEGLPSYLSWVKSGNRFQKWWQAL
jgi:nucleoside-diphosphate-sugar epimerase